MKVLKMVETHEVQKGKIQKHAKFVSLKVKDDQRVDAYDPKKNEYLDDLPFSSFKPKKHVLVQKKEEGGGELHYTVIKVSDES